jgi:hypothetical protein
VLLVAKAIARLVVSAVSGRRPVTVKIQASAEAAPGAGENHYAARAVGGDGGQLVVQCLTQLGSHRVELIGTVQRYAANVHRWRIDE